MQYIINTVQKHQELILETERFIWHHPETGYREVQTSKYLEKIFTSLGYKLTMAENIPGFFTVIDTGRSGPEILILAEMDSIICPDHKEADPRTGAVHSCGHHAQCAALVGIAAALTEPGILDKLCGKIRLCAVPAEELLEIEYRSKLKEEGKIKYFCGKSEFLSRGYFDGVDIAFMVHTSTSFGIISGAVGCIAKKIAYKGVASHAGGAPWNGKNALYAATCGINAVNAIRETFKEPDLIRVHPIITNGGAMVNAIPAEVTIESYVRGSSFDAICEANRKVNQALCGAALSLDTNVDIIDFPGYAPLKNDTELIEVTKEAAAIAIPDYDFFASDTISSGSTDMGDLSGIMPVVHPYAGGASGTTHGSDYYITDPVAACVGSAKLQLGILFLLLSDNGKRAKEVMDNFKPQFASKEEYLSFADSLYASGDRIEYIDGKIAKVNIAI